MGTSIRTELLYDSAYRGCSASFQRSYVGGRYGDACLAATRIPRKLCGREDLARAVESQPKKYGFEEGLVCGEGGASEPTFTLG
jgi:hypothetical protein